MNSEPQKRTRFNEFSSYNDNSSAWRFQLQQSENYSFSLSSGLSSSYDNNVTIDKEIQDLLARRNRLIDQLCAEDAWFPYLVSAAENDMESLYAATANDGVIDLTDEQDESTVAINPAIILDSDDDGNNEASENCSSTSAGVNLENTSRNLIEEDLAATNVAIDNCVLPAVNQPSNLLHKDFVAGENNRPHHLEVKLTTPSEDLSLNEVEVLYDFIYTRSCVDLSLTTECDGVIITEQVSFVLNLHCTIYGL